MAETYILGVLYCPACDIAFEKGSGRKACVKCNRILIEPSQINYDIIQRDQQLDTIEKLVGVTITDLFPTAIIEKTRSIIEKLAAATADAADLRKQLADSQKEVKRLDYNCHQAEIYEHTLIKDYTKQIQDLDNQIKNLQVKIDENEEMVKAWITVSNRVLGMKDPKKGLDLFKENEELKRQIKISKQK